MMKPGQVCYLDYIDNDDKWAYFTVTVDRSRAAPLRSGPMDWPIQVAAEVTAEVKTGKYPWEWPVVVGW
jgi:hypothetical protein